MRRCSNDTPGVIRHLWHGTQIVQDRGHRMRFFVRRNLARVVVGRLPLCLLLIVVAVAVIELLLVEGPTAAALRTPR